MIKVVCNIKYHRCFDSEPSDETEAKFKKESDFYRCKNGDGALDYFDRKDSFHDATEENLFIETDEGTILGYASERPGSSGLFNKDGDITPDIKRDLRKKLQTTDATIYSGVFSFEEVFGNEVCSSKKQAINIMKSSINTLFETNGMDPDNMEWYAALHTNTNNKHIHFSFWEKEKTQYNSYGTLSYAKNKMDTKAITQFKIKVLQTCESNYKTDYTNRDLIRSYFKDNNLTSTELKELTDAAITGQVYKKLTNNQRYIINNIIDNAVENDSSIKDTWTKYVQELEKHQSSLSDNFKSINEAIPDKVLNYTSSRVDELYLRCGNEILKNIKTYSETVNQGKTIVKRSLEKSLSKNYNLNKFASPIVISKNRNFYKFKKNISKLLNIKGCVKGETGKTLEEFYNELEQKKEMTIHGE